MTALIETIEVVLHQCVNVAMLLFEFMGFGVIFVSVIKGFVNYLRKTPGTKLELAEGFAMGLELLLGGEILKTVAFQELEDILFVGGIIALRMALTLLLHWEMKQEREDEEREAREAKKAMEAQEAAAGKERIE